MGFLKRYIIHWNAGQNIPNADDLQHYHHLFGGGKFYNGKYKPEDNINCNDGGYAAHTGGYNTGSIGIALCGNLNFNFQTKQTSFPIQKIDFDNMCKFIAQDSKRRNIPITPDTVMTHYEVGQKVKENKIKRTPLTSANLGKIDIVYLPFYPNITADKMGDFIRSEIKKYL